MDMRDNVSSIFKELTVAAFDPMTEIDAAQVIDAAAESMLVTTAELDWPGPTIVYVNPAFERMTGWHRTEVIGKTPRLLQGPETDRSVFENLRSQLAAGRTWEGTAVNYRKDGSTFMMEWSIVPLRDEAGKIRQYLAVQRDVTARIELNRARTNLSRYFSPQLVKLLANRDVPLGPGRRQDVSVLFIDVVSFTRMAETALPEHLLALLRSFHKRMERLIFRHNGAVLGFIGDAIMVAFGVPETSRHDPVDALACAREMLEEIAEWNAKRSRSGTFAVEVGIGLHCGPVVVGDVGSEQSMAFTVIGDTVNVAARLEKLTRALKCALVVSNDLVRAVRESAEEAVAEGLLAGLDDKGDHPIRGRSGPVRLWALDRGNSRQVSTG
ncbi:adenylate/guanylate cyclase domain-containing protein [Rhizobium leguminosarum]|uniref:adenylate/guanylate cyclase domain-containing protein n=1 Tax=Rhizobium leguminosarum TaxID=384 RepID=UPI00143F3F94|nr:adenylate/guanylate cyclase domain-containing protein [Rhizobium leguminosarum]NKL24717.1 PAS domain S-box protein [Rhizobium leguminosarum bv. viciae]